MPWFSKDHQRWRYDEWASEAMAHLSARRVFACRVDVSTPEIVEAMAKDLGCLRVNGQGELTGACGVMLAMAAGKPSWPCLLITRGHRPLFLCVAIPLPER